MTSINPYLTFNGNCEEAFNFYRSVFGNEFAFLGRFKEMPSQYNVTAADHEKIMHVSLPIGNSATLMGSDTMGDQKESFKAGNNFSISISADSEKEADRLFDALSSNGKISMSMEKTFWGSYFGLLTDQYGVQWMINVDQRPASK